MELNDHNTRLKESSEGIFVKAPPAHQGIADALRSVYAPANSHIPDEMLQLLDQLH